jgi:hypothetical protein
VPVTLSRFSQVSTLAAQNRNCLLLAVHILKYNSNALPTTNTGSAHSILLASALKERRDGGKCGLQMHESTTKKEQANTSTRGKENNSP